MKYHSLRKTPNKAGLVCLLVALGLFSSAFLRTRLSHAQRAVDEVRQSKGLAAAKDQLNAVPGELIVRFQNDAPAARATANGGDLAQFAASDDGRQLRIQIEGVASGSELVEGLRVVRVAPEETADALEILRSRSDVVYAEPNYVRRKLTTPNDPNFASQWSLKNTGQSGGTPGADIHAESAWDVTTGSRNVVVGVIDEGVDINHPDLAANIWTNPAEIPGNGIDDDGDGLVDDVHGWDFFHNDASVYDGQAGDNDTDAHGTHVSGIIGAVGSNSVGVAGVNWQVSILPIKILGKDSEFPASSSVLLTVRAYTYAKTLRDLYVSSGGTRGANIRILNNSYSGLFASQAERDAIRALGDSGILFVAAAGNDGQSNDRTPVFPASYDESNIVSVAATNRSDSPAGFSNYGARTVQMAAPGDEILSTTPNGTYSTFSGTSMAAPHVAGVAALLCAANPSLSLARLRAALIYNGDMVSGLAPTFSFFGPATGILTGRRLSSTGALAAASESDTTPPAAVSNFRILSQQTRRFTLEWIAPGDDATSGRASLYEIRYSDADPRTDVTRFERGYKLFAPLPAISGTTQSVTIDVPFRHTNGFLSIRSLDNVGNASSISAVAVSVNPDDGDPYIQSVQAPSQMSTGGEALNLKADDKYSDSPYQLPFDFNFFGQNGRGLMVSTNGALYFTADPPRQTDPARSADDAFSSIERLKGWRMIAGLWDDLRTDRNAGDDIYVVKPDPTRVIFRWQAVTFDTPTGPNTTRGENPVNFEIELRRDGTIITRYGNGNANVKPVVGISGGDVDTYLAATHSADSLTNLTNAQTVIFTPRKPSPNPTPDLNVSIAASPNPVATGTQLTYQINASTLSFTQTAEQTRVTTQVPAGTSFVSCSVSGGQQCSVNGSTITVDLGTLDVNRTSYMITLVVQVDAAAGATVTETATVSSFWQDPNPANNTSTLSVPVINPAIFNGVRGISGGSDFTASVKSDGTVWTWGTDLAGQLGDGNQGTGINVPGQALNLSAVIALDAGGSHVLALKSDGTVWAWGNNREGEAGPRTSQFDFFHVTASQIPGLSNVTAISAGGTHSMALKSDGTVWIWGGNNFSQLGTGLNGPDSDTPTQVPGLSNVKAIAAGSAFSLAVKTDGTVWAWGRNTSAEVGQNSSIIKISTPTQVAGISDVASAAAGETHALVVKLDGTVWGWGSDSEGQLGDDAALLTGGPTPRQVSGLSSVAKVSAGGQFSIALKNDGTVWAWGLNSSGQVGDGSTVRNRPTPVQVPALSGVTDVGAGFGHSAAVMGDGSVRTWGSNQNGQLGDRTNINRNSPVTVQGALPVATPTFNPDGGSFTSSVSVTMSCSTPGAIMHFTINGNDPTENDLTIGNGQSIQLNTTTTLKARAFRQGWLPSPVKSAVFTFPSPSPTPTSTPVWAAVNQPLAFSDAPTNGTSGAEIYVSNLDGSGRVNLTNFQGDDFRPQWSPDGKRLVFSCLRSPTGGFGGNTRICMINSDGTGFQILTQTSTDEFLPSWSPDGTQITYADSSGIFVMNADGSQRRRVFAAQIASSPDWSPDGRSIAFVLASEIWVTNIFTQTSLRLTTNSSDDTQPRFSPDGSKIVFSSNRDGNYEVYVMNASGAGQTRLTNSSTLEQWPDWSPDGAKIVFTKTGGMTSEIWIMNADGSNQVRVGNGVGATWRTAPNPNDISSFFVRQHYLDFLSREPDVSGLNFWMGDIENCTPRPQCVEVHRINVSASFFLSIEFQQTGFLVERVYKAAYGDAAGNSTFNGAHQLSVPMVRLNEFLADTQRIGRGVVVLAPGWEQLLESNKQAYALEFVQTVRFTSANAFPTSMTPAQFVDKLNQNAGNVLSASERTTAINLFNGAADSSNTTARAQAVRQVAEDQDLYNAEYNRAFVLAQYFGYLRRNPNDPQDSDYTGYDFWLTKLNQFNGNYINAEMVKAFLSSIEYRQRFGP